MTTIQRYRVLELHTEPYPTSLAHKHEYFPYAHKKIIITRECRPKSHPRIKKLNKIWELTKRRISSLTSKLNNKLTIELLSIYTTSSQCCRYRKFQMHDIKPTIIILFPLFCPTRMIKDHHPNIFLLFSPNLAPCQQWRSSITPSWNTTLKSLGNQNQRHLEATNQMHKKMNWFPFPGVLSLLAP